MTNSTLLSAGNTGKILRYYVEVETIVKNNRDLGISCFSWRVVKNEHDQGTALLFSTLHSNKLFKSFSFC